MENNHSSDFFSLEVSPKLREDLRVAALWARIIAMIGGASSLIGIAVNIKNNRFSLFGTIIVLGIALVFYLFMYKFGMLVQKGLDETDQTALNEGFNNINIYFKIIGYLMIIVLVIVVLAFVFGALGAMLRG